MDGHYLDNNYPHDTENIITICKDMRKKINELSSKVDKLSTEVKAHIRDSIAMQEKIDQYMTLQNARTTNKLIRSYYKTGIAVPFVSTNNNNNLPKI